VYGGYEILVIYHLNKVVKGVSGIMPLQYIILFVGLFTGTSNRTVAATQMNATSSRAHTVVTIIFDQISKNDSGQETKKSSCINLVDLAGKISSSLSHNCHH